MWAVDANHENETVMREGGDVGSDAKHEHDHESVMREGLADNVHLCLSLLLQAHREEAMMTE